MLGRSALKIVQKYHPGVTRVVDAKHSAKVKVTKRDCDVSTSKAPNACALAHAFGRKYDGAVISLAVAYLIKGKTATRYRVGSHISRELVSFDRHHDFALGEYQIYAPTGTEKLGSGHSGKMNGKRGKGRKYRPTNKTSGVRSL